MTLSVKDNSVLSTNNLFQITDSANSPITVYKDKVINVENYIISDNLVFKKGVKIPFLWFALWNTGTQYFNFGTYAWTNTTFSLAGDVWLLTCAVQTARSKTGLGTLTYSWAQGSSAGDASSNEYTYFKNNKGFNASNYSLSYAAPTVKGTNVAMNTDNSVFKLWESSAGVLGVTVNSTLPVYCSVCVQF